jgi:hypothetical protein
MHFLLGAFDNLPYFIRVLDALVSTPLEMSGSTARLRRLLSRCRRLSLRRGKTVSEALGLSRNQTSFRSTVGVFRERVEQEVIAEKLLCRQNLRCALNADSLDDWQVYFSFKCAI